MFRWFKPLTSNSSAFVRHFNSETRNHFHPGTLITIMRQDSHSYTPFESSIEMVELACHYLGEGREACQQDIRNGSVMNYYSTYFSKINSIALLLRRNYPALSDYSDSLQERNLVEIFNCGEKKTALIAEIEDKFSKSIIVYPRNLSVQTEPPKKLAP